MRTHALMRCNIHHYCQLSPTAESPSQVRRPKAAACILRVETTMVFSPLSNECCCLESELGQADADSRGRAYTAAARERRGFWCRRLRHERTAAACNGIGCSGRLCSRSAGFQLSGHRGRAPKSAHYCRLRPRSARRQCGLEPSFPISRRIAFYPRALRSMPARKISRTTAGEARSSTPTPSGDATGRR